MKEQLKDLDIDNLWNQFRESRDSKSFRALFDCTYDPLCRYALFIVNDKWDAEEVVLDFFIYIWQHRPDMEISQSVRSYFFRSVRNRCLNLLRTDNPGVPLDEILYKEVPAELSRVDYNDLLEIVQQAVVELSPKCQQIFKLSRAENLSNKEIADDMGISVKAVEANMTRALKIIRTKIKKFYILTL